MGRLVVFVLIWIAGCGSHPTIAAQPSPAGPPEPALKEPAAAMFGLVVDGVYKRQRRIELVEDTVFGWRIKLPCLGPTLFRETLQVPSPSDWTLDPILSKVTRLSDDRRRAVTEDYSGCYDGWIQHTWAVGPDDPPGEYVLSVEVEGYQPQTFRGRFIRSEDDQDGPIERRSRH